MDGNKTINYFNGKSTLANNVFLFLILISNLPLRALTDSDTIASPKPVPIIFLWFLPLTNLFNNFFLLILTIFKEIFSIKIINF